MRFEQELEPHFDLEERLLLPGVERLGEAALAERTRDEHAQLRRLVQEAPRLIESRLSEFGAMRTTLEAIADATRTARKRRARLA